MAKYHINSKGIPAICKAEKGNCPFGGDGEHYDTKEAAQAAADEQNKAEFGIFTLPNIESNFEFGIEEAEQTSALSSSKGKYATEIKDDTTEFDINVFQENLEKHFEEKEDVSFKKRNIISDEAAILRDRVEGRWSDKKPLSTGRRAIIKLGKIIGQAVAVVPLGKTYMYIREYAKEELPQSLGKITEIEKQQRQKIFGDMNSSANKKLKNVKNNRDLDLSHLPESKKEKATEILEKYDKEVNVLSARRELFENCLKADFESANKIYKNERNTENFKNHAREINSKMYALGLGPKPILKPNPKDYGVPSSLREHVKHVLMSEASGWGPKESRHPEFRRLSEAIKKEEETTFAIYQDNYDKFTRIIENRDTSVIAETDIERKQRLENAKNKAQSKIKSLLEN